MKICGKQAKRNFIENIFNLNCFGIMYSDIKNDLNSIKREVSYTNNEIIHANEHLNVLVDKFKDFDTKIKENIQNLKNNILAKATELNKLKNENAQLIDEYNLLSEDNIKYTEMREKIKKLTTASRQLEKQSIEIIAKIAAEEKVLSKINLIKDGLCDVCSTLIETRYDISSIREKLDILNTEKNEKENKFEEVNNALKKCEAQLQEYEYKLSNYQYLKVKIEQTKQTINNLIDEIKKLRSDYDNAENNRENPFEELKTTATAELETLKTKLSTYIRNKNHLEVLKEICSENGVKRFIIKDIVKLLNSLIQKYLNEIGAEYLVYFDETFEFKFITVNGECEYTNFSTGERQRIQIATILAFRDLILSSKINSNIFVIDEFLDTGIDAIAIKNILGILSKKSLESNQSIFIISHRQETTESVIFNHIIEVVKENGISTLNVT